MEKILVGFASFASLAAIGTVLVVVPYMYNAINEVHDEVMDSIQVADVAAKTTGMPDQLIAERLLLEIAGRARRLGL